MAVLSKIDPHIIWNLGLINLCTNQLLQYGILHPYNIMAFVEHLLVFKIYYLFSM